LRWLYYYGAWYLDSKASRWLLIDPALRNYIPGAPVDDEARKRNQSLPGIGISASTRDGPFGTIKNGNGFTGEQARQADYLMGSGHFKDSL
jgi:hypothetical protein